MSCVADCNSTLAITMKYNSTNIGAGTPKVDLENLNMCAASDSFNTSHTAPAVNGTSNIDIKCKNWITQIDGLTSSSKVDYTNVNPNATNNHSWIEHPLDVYNSISCPTHADTHKVDGSAVANPTNPRSNCELYHDFGSSKFGCVKCAWGKTGSKTTYAEPATGESSLGACENMSGCSTNTKYRNINAYWNQFFSCHKCDSTS